MPVVVGAANQPTKKPAAAPQSETFQFHREIIVCGDDPLANTIIDELRGAGARIIRIIQRRRAAGRRGASRAGRGLRGAQ